ncbi:3-oxoacid CoA-transferase (plasmid) [Fusobacteria bacterium ZRK30]|nr:3-oxoacid CoA-transferase [Fusobacteria bacterium ZRK30]
MNGKLISSSEVVNLIKDNNHIIVGGFVGIGIPEESLACIEKKFLESGSPRDLNLVYVAGQGDGVNRGVNHLGHEGLIKTVIGGHYGLAPMIGKLAIENKITGHNIPQGTLAQLMRDTSAGKIGTFTHVGLNTFVDPDLEGGKINGITTHDVVEKISIGGKDQLFYSREKILPKVDYAILKGTYADCQGNISLEKEPLTLDALTIAMATRNLGGKVIVQVEKIVKGFDHTQTVKIPSVLVDYVTVVENPINHMQTFAEQFNESYVNCSILPNGGCAPIPLDTRKVIARRCALLLNKSHKVMNLGIGMPEGVSSVLDEEGYKGITGTVEGGLFGGVSVKGASFGCAIGADCVVDQPYIFDFYDGGGLDVTYLGLAQCGSNGDINVSKFGPKLTGCGGFINISQNAKMVIFCGTFTAGGLKVEPTGDGIKIIQEGRCIKFKSEVEQVSFSSKNALENNQPVYYVTERAVFKLTPKGLKLMEIARGVDLQKDILDLMEFKPIIADPIIYMDERIFRDEKMGLVIE